MKRHQARLPNVIHHSHRLFALGAVAMLLSACGGGGGGGGGTVPTVAFTSLATLKPNTQVNMTGISSEFNWIGDSATGAITTSPASPVSTASSIGLTVDGSGEISRIVISTPTSTTTFSNASGHVLVPIPGTGLSVAFNAKDLTAYFGANPFDLGWNYQTFGIWAVSPGVNSGTDGMISAGALTAGTAIPTTSGATFTGIAAGEYFDPAGGGYATTATLTVNADFVARSLGFSTTGTATTEDFSTYVPNAGLNLSGTLLYAPDTNAFSGTLTSASGTLSGPSSGRFYGPNAEELGGVYFLKAGSGLETMSGAYGAKR